MELFWGKNLDTGDMNHISEVENGLKSNCICPYCNTRLIAKQGEIQTWHFAHENNINCSFTNESALLLFVKQLFFKIGHIKLPKVRYIDGVEDIDVNYQNCYGTSIVDSEIDITKQISEEMDVKIDDIFLEETILVPGEGSYRADIVLVCRGRKIVVEIKVTHETDEYKRKKIIKSNISAIEIDLSGIDLSKNKNSIKDIITGINERKYWVYNIKAHDKIAKEYKKVIYRGKGYKRQSYLCPETNIYHDRKCSDCHFSSYFFSGEGFGYNLCSYPNIAKDGLK